MFGRVLMIALIASTLAVSTALAQVEAKKQAELPATGVKAEVKKEARVPVKGEKSEAEAAFSEAIDVAKKAGEIGDEGQAFLLYTDALLRLRKIRGKYPDFKPEEVNAKIEEIKGVLKSLEEAKCQSLEQEKEGRFRYLVWKRQLLILNKLDKLEEAVAQNEEMLEELKDKFGI